MKKIVLVLICLLMVTGCGKPKMVTCTYHSEEKTLDYELKVYLTFDKDELQSADADIIYETEEIASAICEAMKGANDGDNVTCNGKTINIKNYYQAPDGEDKSRDTMLKYFADKNYTCK